MARTKRGSNLARHTAGNMDNPVPATQLISENLYPYPTAISDNPDDYSNGDKDACSECGNYSFGKQSATCNHLPHPAATNQDSNNNTSPFAAYGYK